ncbi:hypothetical protein ARALYDRAFT_913133 [Arabidopsis lyrata subsp. lyrata]|uniref:Phosphoenolpyruvate carboxylase n=1 Tax=Arabidopsis lyrata subsp. lyrata TaxID=81972 RepID=D7M9B8_ARALL|nr:hypothetical protein ARALYDRAFT_913133 [Arabidopsis lyrata subsp. lyrata]
MNPKKFGSWMGDDRDGNPNVMAKLNAYGQSKDEINVLLQCPFAVRFWDLTSFRSKPREDVQTSLQLLLQVQTTASRSYVILALVAKTLACKRAPLAGFVSVLQTLNVFS